MTLRRGLQANTHNGRLDEEALIAALTLPT